MNQLKLEGSGIADELLSDRNAVVRRQMPPLVGMALPALAVLIPCAICALNLARGRQLLLGYESICEAVTAVYLFAYLIVRNNSKQINKSLAGLSFALICLCLAQVPHATRTKLFDFSDSLLVQTSLCYCLALCGICFVFISLAKAAQADILYWISGSAIAIALFGVQYCYLLKDISTVTADTSFLVFAKVYAGLCACSVAFAALHSLRTLDKFEFTLASAVMLMFALDFAARYNLVYGREDGATVAQCIWVAMVAGLSSFLLVRLSSGVFGEEHHRLKASEWMSVRVIFGISLFFANVVLLVSILVADLLIVKSTFHVTILLLLLFACWIASNALALKLSTDMRSLLAMMPSAKSIVAADGVVQEAVARPIGGRTLMAEVDGMIDRYNGLVRNVNDLVKTIVREKRNEAVISQAQQVAHDIRSPLAAFKVVLPELTALPEDMRTMLRHAIFRIQDIADTLLHSGKIEKMDLKSAPDAEIVMISSLVESVVCEKRIQYRDKIDVSIETLANADGYAIFCSVPLPGELKRILSNIINNAVEAIFPKGSITVSVRGDTECAWIEVRDDGPGIPDELLTSLGQRGLTIGKTDGHGLGLFHACSTLGEWGGALSFEKPFQGGTIARVALPRVEPPDWFLPAIELEAIDRVVVVDDDLSIHGIWDERFARQGMGSLPRIHFSSSGDFLSWSKTHQEWGATTFVLMDYELIGSNETGLDLLAEAKEFTRSALVTSRTEELSVRVKARQLGVRMIPKEVAAYVPIRRASSTAITAIDAVLIDNDLLVHTAWMMTMRRGAKTVRCFSTPEDFLATAGSFAKHIPIFVDQNLADGVDGLDVACKIYSLGFVEVFIQTGNVSGAIPNMPFIRGVVGKEPPAWLVSGDRFENIKNSATDLTMKCVSQIEGLKYA